MFITLSHLIFIYPNFELIIYSLGVTSNATECRWRGENTEKNKTKDRNPIVGVDMSTEKLVKIGDGGMCLMHFEVTPYISPQWHYLFWSLVFMPNLIPTIHTKNIYDCHRGTAYWKQDLCKNHITIPVCPLSSSNWEVI